MKDVASCDKPRGGANGPRSADLRMGEPAWGHAQATPPERIGRASATRGTETSKYPEERKSTETPLVAASERGHSPNPCACKPGGVAAWGLRGRHPGAPDPGRGYKGSRKRNGMERPAAAGESPVRESDSPSRPLPE